ncbi:hypothetical protein, partial [Parvularcula dongshanensis]
MNEQSHPDGDAAALQSLTDAYGGLPVPTSLYCRHIVATLRHADLARIVDLVSPILSRFAKDACEHAGPNPEAAKDDEEDDPLEGRFVIDRFRYFALAMAPGGLRSELAKAVWEVEEVWRGGREVVSWEDVALLFEQPVIDLTFSAIGRGYHLAQG